MERQAVKDFVEKHIVDLVDALGLEQWNIWINYEHCDSTSRDSYCRGICDVMPDYRKATITLNFDVFEDEVELFRTLVHELFHIVLSPFNVYRKAMTQHIDAGSDQDHQDIVLFTHFLEQTIVNLERAWSGTKRYWEERMPKTGSNATKKASPAPKRAPSSVKAQAKPKQTPTAAKGATKPKQAAAVATKTTKGSKKGK